MIDADAKDRVFFVEMVDSPDGHRRAQVRLTTYGICFTDELTDDAAAIKEAKMCAVEEAVRRGIRRL